MKCVDVYKCVRYQISFNNTLKTSERFVPPFWIELCGQTFYVYHRELYLQILNCSPVPLSLLRKISLNFSFQSPKFEKYEWHKPLLTN